MEKMVGRPVNSVLTLALLAVEERGFEKKQSKDGIRAAFQLLRLQKAVNPILYYAPEEFSPNNLDEMVLYSAPWASQEDLDGVISYYNEIAPRQKHKTGKKKRSSQRQVF